MCRYVSISVHTNFNANRIVLELIEPKIGPMPVEPTPISSQEVALCNSVSISVRTNRNVNRTVLELIEPKSRSDAHRTYFVSMGEMTIQLHQDPC